MCGGSFYVSVFLGHAAQVFGQTYFWMFLWECFLDEIYIQLSELKVKQIALHHISGPYWINWWPEQNKCWPPSNKKEFFSWLPSDSICNWSQTYWFHSILPLNMNWNSFLSCQPPSLHQLTLNLGGLHNCVRQFLKLNLNVCTHLCLLFLWRILTKTKGNRFKDEIKCFRKQ